MFFRVAAVNTGGGRKITWSRSVGFQTFESSNFSSLSLFLEAVDFKLRGKIPRAESLPLLSCRLEGEAGFWCFNPRRKGVVWRIYDEIKKEGNNEQDLGARLCPRASLQRSVCSDFE